MAGRRFSRMIGALVWLALMTPLAAADPAIEVRDVLWGFDGTVMRDRFVPLTLVVDNPGMEAFDGDLRLYRTDFAGSRVGGFHVESVYLAPATQRIVQFYPYVISDMENWALAWDGGQMTLPKLRYGGPARVLLADDADLYQRGGAVKRFPARSFPPLPTATDLLGEVVLDHAPDWDAPRRQSLLDWLKQGGTLHLLQGADGRRPQFTSDLAVLNEPSLEFRIGSGQVRVHAIGRAELTGNYVDRQMEPPRRPVEETPEEVERANQYGVGYDYPLEQWQMSSGVFNQLKRMVKVEHDWAVIHLLSLSYVAVLFPGCFLIGREFRNVPITFGAIIGATLLFSGAFYLVGNRGYGESTNVHSIALAEHVEGDRYDVIEWSSVFAIAGGNYSFVHPGKSRLYSDATDNEPVGGTMTVGSAGRFDVDVPPYSTRILSHKSLVHVPTVEMPSVITGGSDPVLKVPSRFPTENKGIYVLIDRAAYPCQRVGDEIKIVGPGKKLREFLKIRDSDFVAGVGLWGQEEEENPDQRLTQMISPLILYSLRLTTDEELKEFYIPEGRARLYVFSSLTEPFELLAAEAAAGDETPPTEPLPSQTGGVLYAFDLAI